MVKVLAKAELPLLITCRESLHISSALKLVKLLAQEQLFGNPVLKLIKCIGTWLRACSTCPEQQPWCQLWASLDRVELFFAHLSVCSSYSALWLLWLWNLRPMRKYFLGFPNKYFYLGKKSSPHSSQQKHCAPSCIKYINQCVVLLIYFSRWSWTALLAEDFSGQTS